MASLYEIVTIINPTETDDGVAAIIGGLRQQILNSGGTILRVDTWGRRRLAYPIRKHDEGVYVLIHAEGPTNLPADFRAHTKIRESILRDLVLKLEAAQEAVVRTQIESTGPEDDAVAQAQIAAAAVRAAEKRAAAAGGGARAAVDESAAESPDQPEPETESEPEPETETADAAPADEPGEED